VSRVHASEDPECSGERSSTFASAYLFQLVSAQINGPNVVPIELGYSHRHFAVHLGASVAVHTDGETHRAEHLSETVRVWCEGEEDEEEQEEMMMMMMIMMMMMMMMMMLMLM
jgi:hypothetical protein